MDGTLVQLIQHIIKVEAELQRAMDEITRLKAAAQETE
jgi:hypothetical protein